MHVHGTVSYFSGGGNVSTYVGAVGDRALGSFILGDDATYSGVDKEALVKIANKGNRGALGFADASDFLRIDAANAPVMLVNRSGNVGIGTTTPAKKLVVNGAIETTRGIQHPPNVPIANGATVALTPYAEGFFMAYRWGDPATHAFGVRSGNGRTIIISTDGAFSSTAGTAGKVNLFDGGAANNYALMAQNLWGAVFNLRIIWFGDVSE